MTSFDFDISEKELAGAEHIIRVSRRLISVFLKKVTAEKFTKAELARRLETNKAHVSRMLRGDANLTLRTIGEICWAMDVDPDTLDDLDKGPRLSNTHRSNLTFIVTTAPSSKTTQISATVQ